jgi:integrating conjugative element membrane protein (TIGR03747 family)
MADTVVQTPKRTSAAAPPVNRGPVGTLVYGLVRFVCWLILGLFGNILMEWLCMAFLWPTEGPTRSQQLLQAEVQYLYDDMKDSIMTDTPLQFAVARATELHELLYKKTGITHLFARSAPYPAKPEQHPRTNNNASFFNQFLRHSLSGLYDYLLAAMISTQVYALRLSVLFLSIPVFVLAGLVGAIDGMVLRDLNKWSGGRELGQRYHLAKSMVAPNLTLPWIIYLAWPTTVHPYLVILPFAAIFGLTVAITTSTFKKYF